jgi:hypothetical protein
MSTSEATRVVDDPARARVILWPLGVTLLLALGMGVFLSVGAESMQAFARFSFAKQVTLPAVYLAFLVALLASPTRLRPSRPFWWYALAGTVFLSLLASVIYPRQQVGLLSLAEGLALPVGFLLVSEISFRARPWSFVRVRKLFGLVAPVVGISLALGSSLTPYNGIAIPIGFVLVYLAIQRAFEGWPRFLALAGGGAIVVGEVGRLWSDPDASLAVVAQVGVCTFLIVLGLLPRSLRVLAATTGTLVGLVYVVNSGYWRLVVGDVEEDWDVTLLHRSYETSAVREAVSHPVSMIFGLGPAATVDLSSSPDASTLIASGRDINAVDDVHILTSWLLLKFGLLGILWGAVMLVHLARVVLRILRHDHGASANFGFAVLAVAVVALAFSAATNLFTNPFFAIGVGSIALANSTQSRSGMYRHSSYRRLPARSLSQDRDVRSSG